MVEIASKNPTRECYYKINTNIVKQGYANMSNESSSFKNFVQCQEGKRKSKKRKKKTSSRVYGLGLSGGNEFDSGMIGERLITELMSGNQGAYTANVLSHVPNVVDEEEEQQKPKGKTGNKIDQARQLFQALINRPDSNRQGIIQAFEQKIGVTHSTSVSYYERLAKEAGLTGDDDSMESGEQTPAGEGDGMVAGSGAVEELPADTELELDDEIDPAEGDRTGIIRTVNNAHLIYKQQTEEGSFEELWIYNIGKGYDEMDVRRNILAGTDIPPKKSESPDGSQTFTVTTLGNAQYLHITGMQN